MGMQPAIEPGLAGILHDLLKIFETAYVYSVTAWVHSGLPKGWIRQNLQNPWLASFVQNWYKVKAAFTLYQCKVNVLYRIIQYTLFATYRAVTSGYLLYVGFNLNYNVAAVATASICLQD